MVMWDDIEINPPDKKDEICSLLQKLNYQYEVHTSNDEDSIYEYLRGNSICITIPNPNCEYSMYVDLEDDGEFTLSYYNWHAHYYPDEINYNLLCENLKDILTNNKCVIVINSKKRWLSSRLSETKIDKSYNYNNYIKELPEEFQEEIKELNGDVELFYWNVEDNVKIDIK